MEKDKTGGPVVLSSPNSRLGRRRQLVLRENTKEETCVKVVAVLFFNVKRTYSFPFFK